MYDAANPVLMMGVFFVCATVKHCLSFMTRCKRKGCVPFHDVAAGGSGGGLLVMGADAVEALLFLAARCKVCIAM